MNKLMTRIFSAIDNREDEILNQFQADLDTTSEIGSLDTDQLEMKSVGDGGILIHDKINDESTLAKLKDDTYQLQDITGKIPIGSLVQVVTPEISGMGILVSYDNYYATVKIDGENYQVPTSSISEASSRGFSASEEFIANINGYDCIINTTGLVKILEENSKMKFNPSMPFNKLYDSIKEWTVKLKNK